MNKYDNGQTILEHVKYQDNDTLVEFVYFENGQINYKRQVVNNQRNGWSYTYNEKGENNESAYLRALDISNLKLNTDLVVLSGCETGLSSGNGLTGLTQSFLQAGAKNIVSSLWQVDDRATSMMMTTLYQNLDKGKGIEKALRNAQITIKNRHQTRHPKYWAGWVHISQ